MFKDASIIIVGNEIERRIISNTFAHESDLEVGNQSLYPSGKPIYSSSNNNYQPDVSSTCTPRSYGYYYCQIVEIMNLKNNLNLLENCPFDYLNSKEFTVMVCIDDNTKLDDCISFINHIKQLRGGKPFRILPVYDINLEKPSRLISELEGAFPYQCRNAKGVPFTETSKLDKLFQQAIGMGFSSQFSDEISESKRLLGDLEQSLEQSQVF
jgi:hypothetical protein